jgi:hypothetical protein
VINKIYEKVIGALSGDKSVLAIFNNGSSIVGMHTPSSDLDFVIIIKDENDKDNILKILRRNFEVFKNEDDPKINVEEQFDILGKRADFTIISKEKMRQKVLDLYKSSEDFLELQHFIKHKVIDSIAVYDPGNLLMGWKKIAEKYPKKIMDDVFNSQIDYVKENLFYWKHHGFRNEFQFGFEQWDVIKAIFQAIYAKNRIMFMLPFKRVHNDMKKLKPNIEKEMYLLIRGENDQKGVEKKIKIVEKIVQKIEKKAVEMIK